MADVGDPNGSSANDAIVVTGNPAIVRPAAVFTRTIHPEWIMQREAKDSLLLRVNLKNPKAGKGCQASLLFDKGFDGDILTAHKAAQLGMEPAADSPKWLLQGANGAQLSGRAYGYMECCLIFETSDGNTVKYERRVAPLKILVLEESTPARRNRQQGPAPPHMPAASPPAPEGEASRPPPTHEGEMSAFNLSFVDDDIVDDEEAPSEMLKHLGEWREGRSHTRSPFIVEVLKSGGCREGYNAVLGLPAMERLHVGVNPVTHRICDMVVPVRIGSGSFLRKEIRPPSSSSSTRRRPSNMVLGRHRLTLLT